MTDLTVFRVYEPSECGPDGYPLAWHERIKHEVRAEAGDRCLRCGHPFVVGESGSYEREFSRNTYVAPPGPRGLFDGLPEVAQQVTHGRGTHWSACDEHCTHGGPFRFRTLDSEPWGHLDAHGTGRYVSEYVGAFPQVEAAWRILTVHHLNERKHDCRWWNLAALCQRCHLTVQRKVQMERVWPWEHSDWFQPFAAGWYAYAYLGENLTREQTVERMGELLALERVA